MTEEKSSRGSRRGRRRYFRPKKEDAQPQPAEQQNRAQDAKSGGASRQRKSRRKARSRQRGGDDARTQQVATEADVEYVTPAAVFIYTHSAHPEMRDSYEFRPDHFSKVGRKLDDYQIDLSSLFFAASAEEDELPLMKTVATSVFNWTDWEEEE